MSYIAAFPIMPPTADDGRMASGYPYPEEGMTLRDYFAARCPETEIPPLVWGQVRHLSDDTFKAFQISRSRARYLWADAMLKARDEQK